MLLLSIELIYTYQGFLAYPRISTSSVCQTPISLYFRDSLQIPLLMSRALCHLPPNSPIVPYKALCVPFHSPLPPFILMAGALFPSPLHLLPTPHARVHHSLPPHSMLVLCVPILPTTLSSFFSVWVISQESNM